jgi:hypothetical protein
MNKDLLREFQLQAGGSHYPDINPAMQEAFAKLIIKDVLEVCNQVNKNFEDWTEHHSIDSMQRQIGVNHCRLAIKERFGINE